MGWLQTSDDQYSKMKVTECDRIVTEYDNKMSRKH